MVESFEDLKKKALSKLGPEVAGILDDLENTVYEAADEIRDLDGVSTRAYADAILGQGNNGPNTARVRCPLYDAWKAEIQAIQSVLMLYDGDIRIGDNRQPLDGYVQHVASTGETPKGNVNVTITVPGQEELKDLRKRLKE